MAGKMRARTRTNQNSKEYWSQREAEQLKHNIKDEIEYNKQIKQIYDDMMVDIQKHIDGFYHKYAGKEGITLTEAKKRVAKLDIDAYSAKAEKYVKNHTLTPQANEEMRLYNLTMKVNRLQLLKANIGLELVDGFQDINDLFNDKLTNRTIAELKRQSGILGMTTEQASEKTAKSIVNASFHNAHFSDRIWMYQDMLKNELHSELQRGLIQGLSSQELARHIQKRFGVSLSNAQRLMQTELARVQSDAQQRSYKKYGYDQYEFIAEPTACPICKKMDGKIFDVNDMEPGENMAPIHPNCRCSTAAYRNREEFEKWLEDE